MKMQIFSEFVSFFCFHLFTPFLALVHPNVSHFNSSCFFCVSFDCHSIHLPGTRWHSIESIRNYGEALMLKVDLSFFFFLQTSQHTIQTETHRNKRALFTLSNVSEEQKIKWSELDMLCWMSAYFPIFTLILMWKSATDKERKIKTKAERERLIERVAKSKVSTSAFLWK